MFDLFYLSDKPNLFPHEKKASSIEEARSLSRTRFFWVVDPLCDYTNWDWTWEPVPWEANQMHAWASQHQVDSGTYLVPKDDHEGINYHALPIIPKNLHGLNWVIPFDIDVSDFDFTWHPDKREPDYIHQFGTQHQITGGPRYIVEGATETKYVSTQRATYIGKSSCWVVFDRIAETSFDFTWHPDDRDPHYNYEFGTQHQRNGGPIYLREAGADIKLVHTQYAIRTEIDHNRWFYDADLDVTNFDFTWHPDSSDPPYIYQFGTQHQATGGPRYVAEGATEIKYVPILRAAKTTVDKNWEIPDNIDKDTFDFTWHPDDRDPPYIYQFGTQHQPTGGPRYVTPGATEVKYVSTLRSTRTSIDDCWLTPENVDPASFDFTWHPDDRDPPYIYQFGTQHQPTGGPSYIIPGATEVKYISNLNATRTSIDDCWSIPDNIDKDTFDFTWHPDDRDPPYIYQFGTQHQITGGPQYIVEGATDTKYVSSPRASRTSIDDCWSIPDNIDKDTFDFTWHPDSTEQPYIYQFGTQHQPTGGPRYIIAGATEVKYISSPRAKRLAVDDCWTVPENMNKDAFDWTWHPDSTEQPYVYQFGTQWSRAGGPVYTVVGATDVKYVTEQVAKMLPTDKNWTVPEGIDINSFDFSWTPDSTEKPYIYQFGTQHQKTGGPIYAVSGAIEVKYVKEPRAHKTSVDDKWSIPDGADISSFDFTWHPDSTEEPYIYQFATQHQKTGGPRYIVEGSTDIKYVDQLKIQTKRVATAIYEIDHLDGHSGNIPDTTKASRYFDNYLDTLKRIAKNIPREHEFVWICSSICDYTDFDFTWHPEQWQATMLHVFSSDGEKFGDTFFMHVPTFQYRIDRCELLEWYDLNFVEGITVPRHPLPIVEHGFDSHVDAIKTMEWKGPLALFTHGHPTAIPCVPLWREKTKAITPISPGAESVIVPRTAVTHVKDQAYDYQYIDKSHYYDNTSKPLDVIFLSNGESCADENWDHLLSHVPSGIRVVRIDGVNGRIQSEQAAATASSTAWYYRVPAKLRITENFNWNWQPDRLQAAKHYIFYARNPVNNLEYGHMATVAFNKNLVLETTGEGLDFAMDKLHEVVPVLSGSVNYMDDAWIAWRSSFRECLKLMHSMPDVESEWRLQQWLTVDTGDRVSEWSRYGAKDAVEFYKEVNGNFEEIRKSYEWDWLTGYLRIKRGVTPQALKNPE